jgi:hypothetical protein
LRPVISVRPVVSETQLSKNWVFFPKSETVLFRSLILLNIVKNTPPVRKVISNELEVYLFSFKLNSHGHLQAQYFSQKWHITENIEKWNLGNIIKTVPGV